MQWNERNYNLFSMRGIFILAMQLGEGSNKQCQ